MIVVPRTDRFALLLTAALAFGCAGEDGAAGANGASGRTALVTSAPEPAGTHCAAGGIRVDSGVDADADGVLDPAEVTATQFVCNGTDGSAGSPGAAALVSLTAEAAGASCAQGGTRIDTGIDADADGVLDPAEVAATRFVCNGTSGSAGAPGPAAVVVLSAEAAGANCAQGGTRIDAGVDADRNGVLDPAEVTATQYVCHGADGSAGAPGLVSLVVLTTEPAGANCAQGGTRIETGIDANRDGVLDPTEVMSTQYVCKPDTYDPAVASVDPAPGPVSTGARFSVTFSKAMDPATIDAASVLLVRPAWYTWNYDDELVPATVSYDAATRTATLVPIQVLWMWELYELHVTSRARDLSGNSLPAFLARYTVEEDRSAPRIDWFTPADGGVAGPSPSIALYFDKQLNSESGSQARLALVDGSGAPVAGTSWWDGWTGVIFQPDAPLAAGERYTASIDAIVADWQGTWDHVTRSWSFSVDAATLPALTGPPVASPASQAPDSQVEISLPVNAAARYAEVSLGDDVTGWATPLGSLWGNDNGEGRLTGTFWVPTPPAPGNYSIWVYLRDASGTSESFYAADAAVSSVCYTTWDSVDGTFRESTIPLSFLQVTGGGWIDLAAEVDFVPGATGAGNVTYTIRNFGTGNAGPFVAGIFVNPATVPAPYAVPDYWLDFQGLPAGGTVAGTVPVSGLPATVTRVFALTDITASIPDSQGANNLAEAIHRWAPGTAYANAVPVAIVDNDTVASTTAVSGGPASIAEATVTLNVTHPVSNELIVSLTSPAGTTVTLVANRGWGADLRSTVLDDLAVTSIGSGVAPLTGTFQPETPLGALAGQDANGTWTLTVQDVSSGNTGTLDSWTLRLW